MIKLENTKIVGLESAIRGMRNPKNSWEKSDSFFCKLPDEKCSVCEENHTNACYDGYVIGPNDYKLMMNLAKAGSVDAKYRRMIVVYVDITAPLYWWKEFDTYKVGTVSNSCSTMHKIHSKEFTLDDFSHEHLFVLGENADFNDLPKYNGESWDSTLILEMVIKSLNYYRQKFIETKDKKYWWQMIQLLPTAYNQRRTIMLNYEVLANIYEFRKSHKLNEWRTLCEWIEELPYSEIIIGSKNKRCQMI